jgi:hypothetical protein
MTVTKATPQRCTAQTTNGRGQCRKLATAGHDVYLAHAGKLSGAATPHPTVPRATPPDGIDEVALLTWLTRHGDPMGRLRAIEMLWKLRDREKGCDACAKREARDADTLALMHRMPADDRTALHDLMTAYRALITKVRAAEAVNEPDEPRPAYVNTETGEEIYAPSPEAIAAEATAPARPAPDVKPAPVNDRPTRLDDAACKAVGLYQVRGPGGVKIWSSQRGDDYARDVRNGTIPYAQALADEQYRIRESRRLNG